MNDLRRIGKTMILNKMLATAPVGWLVSKRDLGGIRKAGDFATQVYRDANSLLSGKKRTLRRMEKLLSAIGEVSASGVIKLKDGSPVPWKDILTRTIADLHDERKDTDEQVVFLWDEVPFLLDNIRVDEGSTQAMEVLDTIRSLSQDYSNVRFVLTGSVGIHHVLSQLRKDGYNNSPLNTFERIAPGPLEHSVAVELAADLMAGAGIRVEGDGAECAEAIASLTGDVAFYIHRLVSRLPNKEIATPATLEECLAAELVATNNDWDLAHYKNRLSKYYPDGNDEDVVIALLDSLAVAKGARSLSDLANETKSVLKADDEQIRRLLKLLQSDHYLTRNNDGHYTFRLEIVRRWWVLERGL